MIPKLDLSKIKPYEDSKQKALAAQTAAKMNEKKMQTLQPVPATAVKVNNFTGNYMTQSA